MALSRPGWIIKSEVRTAVSNLWVELFVACPSGNFPSFHQQIEIKTHAIRALMLELLKMVDRGKIKRLSNYLWRWSYILDKAALIQHKAFRVRPYSKLETVAERRTVHLRGLRAPLRNHDRHSVRARALINLTTLHIVFSESYKRTVRIEVKSS